MRAAPKAPLSPTVAPTLPALPAYTTSELHTNTGGVLNAVSQHGPAVLTRHRWALYVLMSAEQYRALEAQAAAAETIEAREVLTLVKELAMQAWEDGRNGVQAAESIERGRQLFGAIAGMLRAPAAPEAQR